VKKSGQKLLPNINFDDAAKLRPIPSQLRIAKRPSTKMERPKVSLD